MTPQIDKLAALAAALEHLPRSSMTAAQVADYNTGRDLADALTAAARKPGAPCMLLFAALSQLASGDAAIVGFAFRLQQLLAEAPHGTA